MPLKTGDVKKPFVSVVVPAYKQEKTIKEDIENIYHTMSQTRWDFEIVVVVDGIVDNTFVEAKRIDRPNVLVYGYEENKGKGFAIRYGMEKTRGDLIAFIDAGMDINPNGISMILEHMEWYDADVIVGSKRHPVSKINYPFIRKLYSFGYHLLVRILFGIKLTDTQTGLKVFKRNVIATVLPRLMVKEFAFDVEILAVCRYAGFTRIYEAPIEVNWASVNTNFTPFLIFDRNIRYMLVDTLAVFYRMYVIRHYSERNKHKWLRLDNVRPIYGDYYKTPLKFSIIIPVRKINDYVKESIGYINKLKYQNYEVIILTDEPESYDFDNEKYRIISTGPVGPGEKRNIGAKASSGDILAFLDDDAFPSFDWLDCAKSSFARTGIYALGGPAITPPKAPLRERIAGRVLESWLCSGPTGYRYFPDRKRYVNDYPSVNFMVRREAFFSVGGFPIDFWPGEDTKLCLDLIQKFGRGIMYDPNLVVFHHRRRLFIKFLEQVSRYGRHRGQFARIYPQTSRLPGYFVPSLFTLGLIFGPLLMIVFKPLALLYFGFVLMYLLILLLESIRVVALENNLYSGMLFVVGAFETHLIYGISFIIGFVKRPYLKLRSIDPSSGSYIGG
jgi:glycosyltransferase involved in cell wall biosynthesis